MTRTRPEMKRHAPFMLASLLVLTGSACQEGVDSQTAPQESVGKPFVELGLPELAPGFRHQYLIELSGGAKLCAWGAWSDAVVFARVRDVRFITEPVVSNGRVVGCAYPVPAVELELEPLEVFLGELPERFVLTLGGDLDLTPPLSKAESGWTWDEHFEDVFYGTASSLQPGHTVGMFMRRLDDEGQRWSLTWQGWFGMRADRSIFEYPAGAFNFEPRLDGLSSDSFREALVACIDGADAQERSDMKAAIEKDRAELLATGRAITAYCIVPDGTYTCSDEECAAEHGF